MDYNRIYFIYAFRSIFNPCLSKECLLLMLAGVAFFYNQDGKRQREVQVLRHNWLCRKSKTHYQYRKKKQKFVKHRKVNGVTSLSLHLIKLMGDFRYGGHEGSMSPTETVGCKAPFLLLAWAQAGLGVTWNDGGDLQRECPPGRCHGRN